MVDKRFLLAQKLRKKDPATLNMVIGFDGFVDEIIHVIDKRMDSENYTRIDTIEAYAKRIEKASGLSTNIELQPIDKKIGGNGPIMCNALSKLNSNITYIGSLGYPSIDDVFKTMEDKVTLYSIANNGHTDALEFFDGKLLMGKMSSLNNVTYKNLIDSIGLDKLIEILSEVDLFATVNWSMLPHMTDMWKALLENVIPKLPKRDKKPYLFVDLADPEKRENVEIKEALELLKEFSNHFFVVLGLNKKEAYDVANVLELFDSASLENMQVSMEDLNIALYEYLKIQSVVIHPVDRASTVIKNVFVEELGPYIAKPKLTTGAGDNFNAGFMLGLLLGLKPNEALLTGVSTSGFYVRNARSPNYRELVYFIEEWALGNI
ncbi:PfkB family carbohydrate kinase [Mycoplasmatota bacterium WC30]